MDSPSSSFHAHVHAPAPLSIGAGKISTPRKSSSSTTPPASFSTIEVPSACVAARPVAAVIVTQGFPIGI